jgi:hypothetical protein
MSKCIQTHNNIYQKNNTPIVIRIPNKIGSIDIIIIYNNIYKILCKYQFL